MGYTYTTKIAPVAADVVTVATWLAQRQSDAATTNGGITATGSSVTVPQLGVDAPGLGLAYMDGQADVLLAAVGYQQQNDQAGTGQTTNSTVFANVFAAWSPILPMTKTYLLHIDLSCYCTGAADQVVFQFSLTGGGASPPANASKFTFSAGALSVHQRISWRMPVAFSSVTPSIQLQWRMATGGGSGGTVHADASDVLLLSLTG